MRKSKVEALSSVDAAVLAQARRDAAGGSGVNVAEQFETWAMVERKRDGGDKYHLRGCYDREDVRDAAKALASAVKAHAFNIAYSRPIDRVEFSTRREKITLGLGNDRFVDVCPVPVVTVIVRGGEKMVFALTGKARIGRGWDLCWKRD